ncbi:MAG: ferredoxin [Elusimicrobia bacterium]|nr:ferredoxin [Elusimicrobiota bacterium]
MKAIIDEEACIGCGVCAGECPEVFEMNADNKAIVKGDTVPANKEETCKTASENCPVTCIKCE